MLSISLFNDRNTNIQTVDWMVISELDGIDVTIHEDISANFGMDYLKAEVIYRGSPTIIPDTLNLIL